MSKQTHSSFLTYGILYGIVSFLLLAYSYTQVDLSLTLSQASFIQYIQKMFQAIGYFQRPLSSALFTVILFLLFVLYGYILNSIAHKRLSRKDVLMIIAIIVACLFLSYPAFSYDYFNYLFTAKTILVYHKNPYMVIPLQFAGIDPWLSFMHWTHLPSAYTPLWVLLSLPSYLFGFGYLLLSIWSLKLVMVAGYLAAAKGIESILVSDDRERSLLGMAVFAFNPLVIIETLVSPHNDIVMMALVLWALWFFKQKRIWASWIVFSLSVALKLMTIFLTPVYFMKWNRKIPLACMAVAFAAVLTQREVLSWYWLWVIPFVAIIPGSVNLTILSAGISMGLLLRYTPFLYFGHWNDPVPLIKDWVTGIPIAVAIGVILIRGLRRRSLSGEAYSNIIRA
jgi:hypothetical protein